VAPTATTVTTEPTLDVTGCRLFATFQEDLSVPDGTRFQVGEAFTKTWRVRNTGYCPWGPGYHLTFVDGDQMGGPDSVPIPPTEARRDAAISVDLVAPAPAGRYRGVWRICVVGGRCFGDRLTVDIRSIE
jgi:hypothetical protein